MKEFHTGDSNDESSMMIRLSEDGKGSSFDQNQKLTGRGSLDPRDMIRDVSYNLDITDNRDKSGLFSNLNEISNLNDATGLERLSESE